MLRATLLVWALVPMVLAATILVLTPLSTKSHVRAFLPLFRALSQRAHNLTLVSAHLQEEPPDSWVILNTKNYLEEFVKDRTERSGDNFFRGYNPYFLVPFYAPLYVKFLEHLLRDGILQQLLDQNLKFDLVIGECFYTQHFLAIFGHIYNAPFINLESHYQPPWSCYLTGNSCPFSYIPNYKTGYSDRMTFLERLDNTILSIIEILIDYYYSVPQQEKLIEKYLRHPRLENHPPLIELLKNTSFTLLDSHFSYGYPKPYTPNMAEVGGMTDKKASLEDLDEDFKKFIDNSENGVIYFAFGTFIPLSHMPKETAKAFFDVFRSLRHNVIVKWDGPSPDVPKNVKLVSWAPQETILAHKKCVLFISHCGIHSMMEAIHYKVPLLVIPFLSDQHFNARYIESRGLGYVMSVNNLTFGSISHGINTILNNKSYRHNMEKQSSLIQDRQVSSLDTAIYWVEYILRHGGEHLRPASTSLDLATYLLLDITLSLAAFLLATAIFVYSLSRLCSRRAK